MEYELTLRYVPERLQPQDRRYQELRDRWLALKDRPLDDPEMRAATEAFVAASDPCVFIIYITDAFLAALRAAGMLATEGSPLEYPDWRGLPRETLDGRRFISQATYPEEICTPEQVAYMHALDHWRRYRATGNVGIQAWKLETDDHWIVTAEECAEALRAWESLGPDRQQEITEALVEMEIAAWDAPVGSESEASPDVIEDLDGVSPAAVRASVIAEWGRWVWFLRDGAEGDGFFVH